MTIWKMVEPRGSNYAEPALRGTWSSGVLCAECKASTERRVQPLVVEWQPGSDQIGDFSWASSGCIVITDRVHRTISASFCGYEIGPVELIQNPKLKTKRGKRRVWLPYEGPPLHEMRIISRVHMEAALTSAELIQKCQTCGSERWALEGYEQWERNIEIRRDSEGQIVGYQEHLVHYPRVPGMGLFVRSTDIKNSDIFGVHEFPGWILCTNRLKVFIEQQAFTNIDFMEMGDLV